MNQRYHHSQQQQLQQSLQHSGSSCNALSSVKYSSPPGINPNQAMARDRHSLSSSFGGIQSNKHGAIQFINETDSIIADSNGRIFSSIETSSPMDTSSMNPSNVGSSKGGISTGASTKRSIVPPPDYLAMSDESCDSYDDEINQLVFTSRDQCRRPESSSEGSSGSLVINDGPRPGKKTKGRVKIKMEFIENKLRRYTTFSKRKTGIMKKAYELSTLTGTQVMLLVASETGHVYTFATRKLQPMITSDSGKALIQTCLNSPDIPVTSSSLSSFDDNCTSPDPCGHHGDASSTMQLSNRTTASSGKHDAPTTVTSSFEAVHQAATAPCENKSATSQSAHKAERLTKQLAPVQCSDRRNIQGQGQDRVMTPLSDEDQSTSSRLNQRLASENNDCATPCKQSRTKDDVILADQAFQTKTAVTTSAPEQKPTDPAPDKQWLPQPLFYKLPGSNQFISLPGQIQNGVCSALKSAGVSTSGSGTLIYQTPQGLLFAGPTSLIGALQGSDGCLLSTASATSSDQQDNCHKQKRRVNAQHTLDSKKS